MKFALCQVETAIIAGRDLSCWNESVIFRLKSKNSMSSSETLQQNGETSAGPAKGGERDELCHV